MQSNMQLNQGSKQHFDLSEASFNKKKKKMLSILIPKHKHTHTLKKSNQFYISKTSQENLVSIH